METHEVSSHACNLLGRSYIHHRPSREARHPNVVLYLGLSRAPDPDGRIFIVSEFIENGNLRSYIHDKNKPFPWRLRLSFATDISRALAYLHARRCIHRDLKGENLLVTSNGRLKITDFGFARIAARNADESKRLTFCGTDSYMSPEILLGNEFDLPTDIYSLGVIFCEIASRKLADDSAFKRSAPSFAIEEDEVRKRASSDCPPAFIQLCIDCLSNNPSQRPTTRMILDRLRDIEAEVLSRASEADDLHVGTIKYMTGAKRPNAAPRIPSFGMGVGKDIGPGSPKSDYASDDSDEETAQAVEKLSKVGLTSTWSDGSDESAQPPAEDTQSGLSDYSTTVIRQHQGSNMPSLSSVLTVRPTGNGDGTEYGAGRRNATSAFSVATFQTAHSSISTTAATEGGSTVRSVPSMLVHRFTLLKPGAKRSSGNISPPRRSPPGEVGWNPFERIFTSGLLTAKCDICTKRIGWKPVLECDDCGLRAHVKCGDVAPRDCGLHHRRQEPHSIQQSVSAFPKLSKAK